MADDLLSRIEAATHALHGAQQAAIHSNNAETLKVVAEREEAIDILLKLLWSRLTPEQRAEVEARPIRKLVSA